ncbi:MAG: 50S ribosomal protein L11 methyltransferase [Rhodocyclaceae bacterium]|nr:50S ribosomal protein L11 methyltransferase [Rhodocyclaceae bacterium]
MWLSVSVQTDPAQAEALSDALMELGALSVSVEDADAGTERERPQFGEPGSELVPLWQSSRVIALLQPETDVAALLGAAAEAVGLDALPPWKVDQVEEQNWVQLTQAQFDPIKITDRLWIVPSWHEEPDPAAINLVLDPGMAFGTGSHPTTFLCLSWLCDTVQPGESLLDYGCGSGILAIAAARLGAGRVVGVDIDDQALKAAADNAVRNDVEIHLLHSSQPLATQFHRVVANILTNPLCVLAPLLAGRVAPGGSLALSGVLETQAQQVIAAYAPFIALSVARTHEGWVLLTGQKP